MAQTGDVQHGNMESNFDIRMAGRGGSEFSDVKAEFSGIPHDRGTLGAARSSSPDSANSQFFINFSDNHFLNRQYTVYGPAVQPFLQTVVSGACPDKILSVHFFGWKTFC